MIQGKFYGFPICWCYRNGLELSRGNRRFPTNFHGLAASNLNMDKKLPVNVGGGGNSQLPYKSFPFRTLLATEIREIAHCYNFRRRWLPACHWSHLQKPLIGIGAKLFDGVTILRWRAWPRSGRGLWWALSSCHRHTAIKSLRVTL